MMLRRGMMGGEKSVKYGYLYNWYVTQGINGSSLIPLTMSNLGWSVPNAVYNDPNDPYSTKVLQSYTNGGIYSGSEYTAYTKLREMGTQYWATDTVPVTNLLKFGMRGSSFRAYNGGFSSTLTHNAAFWSKDIAVSGQAYYVYFSEANSTMFFNLYNDYTQGNSIRLVRAATGGDPATDGAYCDPYIGNDGQKYLTVKIGTQVWLAENLAETKYRNGDAIPNVTDNTAWAALTTGARCAYNNDESKVFL